MFRPSHHALAASLAIAALPTTAHTQDRHSVPAISVSGDGPQTVVLLSGLVGGVGGYRRLEARLLGQHQRVVIVTSPGAQILDVTGPLEVFSSASRFLSSARLTSAICVRCDRHVATEGRIARPESSRR